MPLVPNQILLFYSKYWQHIMFAVIIVLTQMSFVRTLPTIPNPVFLSQPQFIETGMYKFLNIPVIANQAVPSSIIFEDYTVTLIRIHKILPFNYDVAISLTGLGYYYRSTQNAIWDKILLSITTKSTTSFTVRGFIQSHTFFLSLSGRYFAYNTNYMTDFYLLREQIQTPVNTNFDAFRKQYKNFTFPSGTSSTTHSCHLMLEGLDIILSNPAVTTAQWVAKVVPLPQPTTEYSFQIWGQGCLFQRVFFTLMFYVNEIDYISAPKYRHTKIYQLPQHACNSNSPTGTCLIYDTNLYFPSFPISDNNFMIGINYFKANNLITFQIRYNSGVIQDYRIYLTGVAYVGFLMYGYTCIDGYFFDNGLQACTSCPLKCLKCTSLLCSYCDIDYVLSSDGKYCESVFTPSLEFSKNCLSFNQTGDIFTCLFCNITRKLYLNDTTFKCECKSGFAFNTTSQMCQDICGDSIKLQKECDDGNTLNNDGCDSECRLQVGFNCITTVSPTVCRSAYILKYKIDLIQKIQDEEASGLIILSPTISSMPFEIKKQNFFTNNSDLTHLNFNLILKNNLVETVYAMDFQLQKVQNNKIYLYFKYNFTVQKLDARIFLNYEQTQYMPTNQTLDFQLTGLNAKFQFTTYYQAYSTVSKGIMVTTFLGLFGLVIGLFLPKFIGIQTIITLQLIFYSQILIINPEDWPVGFFYLKYLKISTGYNDFVFLTNYFQLTNITKKFSKIFLKKTIIENFNCSFVILIFFALVFYLISLIRSKMETNIETYIKVNKIQDINRNFVVKKMMEKFQIPLKISEIAYCVISQLCVWSVLPIISSVGGEFLIQNSMITLRGQEYDFIFLKLRGAEFFIILFVIFSVALNHFKNAFLSRRTLKKIQQRPQELLYKQLLFIYLFVMGGLIFFFNDIKLGGIIPISVIALGFHIIFTASLLLIQPYKQSLRIHAFTLYMNQVLYGVFLIVINLINLINNLNEPMVLYIGYAITGWVAILILMTFVRLYYEIRYGEALEKQIQAQRKKQAEEEDRKKKLLLQKKIDMLQKQAKQKLTKQQQKRDMNSYLLETQQKQQSKKNLLEWIEGRNWQQQQKQKYFFKYHHEKPLQWIKNKQSEEFKKRIKQIEQKNIEIQKRNKKQKEDPEYIDTVNKMRKDLQVKKRLLRSFKKQARIKTEQNKWTQSYKKT